MPDYDESIIQRAVQTLGSKQLGEYAHRQRLEGLAAGVGGCRCAWVVSAAASAAGGAEEAATQAGACCMPLLCGCSSAFCLGTHFPPVLNSSAALAPSSTAVRQLRGESGAAAAAEQGTGAPPNLSFGQEEPADVEAAYVAALEELSVSFGWNWNQLAQHLPSQVCPFGSGACGRRCRVRDARPCVHKADWFGLVRDPVCLQVGDFDSAAQRAYNRSFAAKAERQEGDRTGGRVGAGRGWAWTCQVNMHPALAQCALARDSSVAPHMAARRDSGVHGMHPDDAPEKFFRSCRQDEGPGTRGARLQRPHAPAHLRSLRHLRALRPRWEPLSPSFLRHVCTLRQQCMLQRQQTSGGHVRPVVPCALRCAASAALPPASPSEGMNKVPALTGGPAPR